MSIKILDMGTEVVCDICGYSTETARPDGVVPAGWMTGHLWLDISLSEQRQTPLCFCPTCAPSIVSGLVLSIET